MTDTKTQVATVAVDAMVLLMRSNGDHRILLIKRKEEGTWAMPGGRHDHPDETTLDAAIREVKEECNFDIYDYDMDNVAAVILDLPDRDPRSQVVSIMHIFVRHEWATDYTPLPTIEAGDDAKECYWIPFADLASGDGDMEFFADHGKVIEQHLGGLIFAHDHGGSDDMSGEKKRIYNDIFGPVDAIAQFGDPASGEPLIDFLTTSR